MTPIQANNYSIYFNDDSFVYLENLLKTETYSKIFVLVDENTNENCLPYFLSNLPTEIEIEIIEIEVGEENKAEVKKINININLLRYHNKNGWTLVDDNYYKFICRKHSDLRFWNSLDALVPVIQKIEKEDNAVFELRQNGCTVLKWALRLKGGNGSFDLPNWSNNVFKVIVKYLETK